MTSQITDLSDTEFDAKMNSTRAVIADSAVCLIRSYASTAEFRIEDYERSGDRRQLIAARKQLVKIAAQQAEALAAIDRILETGK